MRTSLLPGEIERASAKLGRPLTEEEIVLLDTLWSEHCSYKSSRLYLRSFSYTNGNVLMGVEDWQDAGAVDIGDGWALIMKLESHNHPSAVDPFNGAATGIGGVIRDIISKGALPIALLDMIRVGPLERVQNRWLLKNIIAGIGFYGNSIGVPVVGGEISFDQSYNNNPLVDVGAIGVVRSDKIVPSVVKEKGLKLVLVGLTGLDGLGGASFASRKLSGEDEIGAVQIADPFAGKVVIDTTMEVLPYVNAIKDLGGGGLAVAVTEMSNGFGALIQLDRVPLRVPWMSPLDILVSETQERMLYAAEEKNAEKICEIFKDNDFPCSIIGEITGNGMMTFKYGDKTVVEMPSDVLLEPPLYRWRTTQPIESFQIRKEVTIDEIVRGILRSPELSDKGWAYSQFDYEVGTSTVLKPGESDAGVISLPNGKLLGVKGDANPDWCAIDPYECGKGIFAESVRNLASVGARPIAAVDHLQFGDPKKPHVYYHFVEAVRGIGEASRFFEVPIVGGKVSFYNEDNNGNPIKPTPLIMTAGILERLHRNSRYPEGYLITLGYGRDEMSGSLACKTLGLCGGVMKSRIQEDKIASDVILSLSNMEFVTDISRGGLLASVFKLLYIGQDVSIRINSILASTDDSRVKISTESGLKFLVVSKEPDLVIRESERRGMTGSVIGEVRSGSSILSLDESKYDCSEYVKYQRDYLEEGTRY